VINSLAQVTEINLLTNAATEQVLFASSRTRISLNKRNNFVRDANGSIIVNSQAVLHQEHHLTLYFLGKATI
jgi:hypothetical protein